MSLSKKIVIVNEFTNSSNSSRGSTPGTYVTKYVARGDAVDVMYPIQTKATELQVDSFVSRYMMRQDATEQAIEHYDSKTKLEYEFDRQVQGDGRAFGNLGLSYRHSDMENEAARIQKCFDDGHTVLKTVVSFETDYLKEQGILPEDFNLKRAGDFRGKVDQMKLRMALNEGMKEMTRKSGFDKPVWVGAIQVDTKHVHAHFALTEEGKSSKRVRPDGQEKGKLSKNDIEVMRRGIHRSLRQNKQLNHMHMQADSMRRDTVMQTRKLVHHHLMSNVLLQQIIASLPKDRQKWRYGSNDVVMKRPNMLMTQYIEHLQQDYDAVTGFSNAKKAIEQYADESEQVNYLTPDEKDTVRERGEALLRERVANGIYKELKDNMRDDELTTTTPMIVTNSHDMSTLQQVMLTSDSPNALTVFAYRSRMYTERLHNHIDDAQYYHEALQHFDDSALRQEVGSQAYAMRDFYVGERDYHMRVTDKYRTFVSNDGTRDAEFHVAASTRSYLEKMREDIINDLNDSPSDPQGVISTLAQQLVDDDLIQSKYSTIGDTATNRSVYDVVNYLTIDPSVNIPTETVRYLNGLGQGNKQYANMGTRMLDAQVAMLSEHVDGDNILPVRVEKKLDTYTVACADYTFKEWGLGKLDAVDVVDANKLKDEIKYSGDVPELPELKSVNHLVSANSDYAKSVQGLDLHDVVYDFHPLTPRGVGRKHVDTYVGAVDDRLNTTAKAVEYLSETGQRQQAMIDLFMQLKAQRKFAKYVDEHEELPRIEVDGVRDTVQDYRYYKSIDLDLSYQLTKDHLKTVLDEQQVFVQDIRTGDVSELAPVTSKAREENVREL